jgi:hypothetical protein
MSLDERGSDLLLYNSQYIVPESRPANSGSREYMYSLFELSVARMEATTMTNCEDSRRPYEDD